MSNWWRTLAIVGFCMGSCLVSERGMAEENGGKALAHMVFFKLKDNSPEAAQKLVDACKKYLSDHEGTLYFSAGVRAKEMKRSVNDTDFDVALHLVFCSKAAHDKYQNHPRHLKFIEENKDNWAGVRVFDSYVDSSGKK